MKAELINHKPIPLPPPTVILTLTYEEARSLLCVCNNIGGNSDRRDHTDAIGCALENIGVSAEDFWCQGDLTLKGSVPCDE